MPTRRQHWRSKASDREIDAVIPMGYHTPLIRYLLEGREDEARTLREEPATSLVSRFLSLVPHAELPASDAIPIVKQLQNLLEQEMRQIVAKHSIYYWLHLNRRCLPGGDRFDQESPLTVLLYTNVAECTFIKYGTLDPTDDFVEVINKDQVGDTASGNFVRAIERFRLRADHLFRPGTFLRRLDFNDLVDLYRIHRLAYEYWHCSASLRRLYKGGYLRIPDSAAHYHVRNDASTERLIRSYDQRLQYGRAASTSGISLDPPEWSDREGWCLLPQWNVHHVRISEYPFLRWYGLRSIAEYIPNFVWVPVSFSYISQQHELWSSGFEATYGFSLNACLTTLFLIAQQVRYSSGGDEPQGRAETLQRAYKRWTNKEQLVHSLRGLSEDLPLPSPLSGPLHEDEITRVLDHFQIADSRRERISLTTMGPRPLTIPMTDGTVIVDYYAILRILDTLTHDLRSVARPKGSLFERFLEEKVGHIPQVQPWVMRRRIYHADGTSKEIDASFILGAVLFVCELKCVSRSFAFEEGKTEALAFRRRKFIEALREVDGKAKWLVAHPSGRNYSVPRHVKVIVPIVVSPFVEYIWSTDADLWLTDSVPRVCLPDELDQVVSGEGIAALMSRPYVRYFAR